MIRTFSLLLAILLVSAAQGAERPPNVVLFLIDDLGWADLACYGSKLHETPHLDRLAKSGVRFTQAYAACPVCSPTRAAVLTGKVPARLHLTDWLPGRADMPGQRLLRPKFRQELPLSEITLAEVLKDAKYATASIGKWHLGGPGFEPQKQGFDVNVGGDAAGSPRSYFAPYVNKNSGPPPGLEEAPEGEYLTDRLAAEAVRFIEQNKDRPFFLYCPHYGVHTPLKGKPELVAKYEEKLKTLQPGAGSQRNPIYAAMIESVDDAVGRVLDKLDELQLTERTVVIFTSDNGGLATLEGPDTPATINAPLREGKGWLYEGGIRVPLMIRVPGMTQAGTESAVPVTSVDFFPTVVELTGQTYSQPLDGTSLVPVLKGAVKLTRKSLYWHYPHYANQGSRPGAAVRHENWKLIEFYGTGRKELFDLSTSPGEGQNVADQQPERVQMLSEMLDRWRKDVAAQMNEPNPDYVPNPPQADGVIVLPARTADVFGSMLRYEPLPHKNTLGYWVRADDYATWAFTVKEPGTYEVTILQGCGTGSGNSEVDFRFGEQILPVVVEETGGFQNFVPRKIGSVKFDRAGRFTLEVKPTKKPGVAVMDLREVRLTPVQ